MMLKLLSKTQKYSSFHLHTTWQAHIYIYIYIWITSSDLKSFILYKLFHEANLNPQETYDYWQITKLNMEEVFSAASPELSLSSPELSLSWHFEEVKFWHEGKRYQFLGGGWVLLDEASWECRSVLLHTVCISLSLDWMVVPVQDFPAHWICGSSGLAIPNMGTQDSFIYRYI